MSSSGSEDFNFVSGDSDKFEFFITSEGPLLTSNLDQNNVQNSQKSAQEKDFVSQDTTSLVNRELEICNDSNKATQESEKLPKLSELASNWSGHELKSSKEFGEASNTDNPKEPSNISHDNSVNKNDESDSDDDEAFSSDSNDQLFSDEEFEGPVDPKLNKLIPNQLTRSEYQLNSDQFGSEPNIESGTSKEMVNETSLKPVQTGMDLESFNDVKSQKKVSNLEPTIYEQMLLLKSSFHQNVSKSVHQEQESTVSGTSKNYSKPETKIFENLKPFCEQISQLKSVFNQTVPESVQPEPELTLSGSKTTYPEPARQIFQNFEPFTKQISQLKSAFKSMQHESELSVAGNKSTFPKPEMQIFKNFKPSEAPVLANNSVLESDSECSFESVSEYSGHSGMQWDLNNGH